MAFGHITWLFITSLLCAMPVWADHHHELDWAQTLALSSEQQQQIKTIEAKYRNQLKALHPNCNTEKRRRYLELQEQMRLEIQQILRPAQQKIAQQAIFKQRRIIQAQQAREVALALNMDAAQKDAFFAAVQQQTPSAQWPMSMEQQEQAHKQFKALVKAHSSAKQWQAWQEQQTNNSKKWHQMDEFRPPCASDH